MTDMRAEVVLDLVDGFTRPARQVTSGAKALIKELQRFKSLSFKANGMTREIDKVARSMKKAQAASGDLRKSISRPVGNGYARATTGLNSLRSAANSANAAAQRLNRTLRNGGGSGGPRSPGRGGAGGTGSGGRGGAGGGRGGGGGHGHGGGGFFRRAAGVPMHVGGGIAHSFGHALAYQATEGVIEGVVHSVKTGMEQAFEKQHTIAMLKMQGESQKDIAAAVRQSQNMAKILPQFTSAQHLESIAELRPALLGGLEEATKLAPMFQQAIAILEAAKQGAGKKALGGVNTHGEALSLVRALEVKNVTGLGEQAMQNYVDSITKAIVAFNGQIKAEDFHSAFKYSRGDSVNWSKEFSTEILPTLMNELKKSSKTDASMTGNALKSMSRVVMDGVMGPDLVAKWDKLGMFAPGAMKKNKKGELKKNPKFMGGVMLGADVWQSNPYQWVQDYLLPHMKEHGVDISNRKQVVGALGGLFGNRVANQIAQILATQQAIIRKDQENVKKAQGTSGLNWLMNADPTARMHVLASVFKELAGSLGELAFPGTMRGMKGLIDWAHNLSESIGKSSYAKSLGSHFDAAMAGLFGQRRGRKQFAKGRDNDYYVGGVMLGEGWSRLTAAVGKTIRFWEEVGVVSGSMKALGAVLTVTAVAFDVVRAGMEQFRDALQHPGDVWETVKTVLAQSATGIFEPLKIAISGIFGWVKSKFPYMIPDSVKHPGHRHPDSMQKTVSARKDAASVKKLYDILENKPGDIWHMPKKSPYGNLSGIGPFPVPSKPFGLSGFQPPAGGNVVQPITSSVNAAIPQFAAAGGSAVAALASGIASGSGGALSAMSGLMSSLTTIGAKGVNVPVNLDTSGAEAKLNALIAKAGSIGSGAGKGGAKPQFSKALNDTGG